MRHIAHVLLMTAATLAVAWAQTFGIQRGWICDCGDTLRLTFVDHCHGPHSSACHEDEDHDLPHQHDEDEHEDRHEHAAVVEDLVGKQHEASVLQMPVLKVLAVTQWDAFFSIWTAPRERREEPPDKVWNAASPPWPHILTHAIVLRV